MNNSIKKIDWILFCYSLQLKKEQELQKQMLWHTFQEKNKQLELQHKWQLEHKFQVSIDHNYEMNQNGRKEKKAKKIKKIKTKAYLN